MCASIHRRFAARYGVTYELSPPLIVSHLVLTDTFVMVTFSSCPATSDAGLEPYATAPSRDILIYDISSDAVTSLQSGKWYGQPFLANHMLLTPQMNVFLAAVPELDFLSPYVYDNSTSVVAVTHERSLMALAMRNGSVIVISLIDMSLVAPRMVADGHVTHLAFGFGGALPQADVVSPCAAAWPPMSSASCISRSRTLTPTAADRWQVRGGSRGGALGARAPSET